MSKSNFHTLLGELKLKFLGEPMPPVDPANPAPPAPPTPPAPVTPSYALADGTPVMIDKLEVGGIMQIGGVPAPAGEHQLADGENGAPGTKVTTDASGMITNVVPAAPPAAPPVDPAAPPMDFTTPTGVQNAFARFADATLDNATRDLMLKALFENRFSYELQRKTEEEALEAYRQSFAKAEQTIAKHEATISGLLALVEEIAGEPTEKPVETRKSMFSKEEDKDRGARRRDAIAKL